MVEIRYSKSNAGHDNCFLILHGSEYIQKAFFKQNSYDPYLYFYISLLHKFGMVKYEDRHGCPLIWSTHYNCMYKGVPFTMIFDEDYEMLSFSVKPEDAQYRTMIAERIAYLIEHEWINVNKLKM